jgi:SAM-dependent methyltransferase
MIDLSRRSDQPEEMDAPTTAPDVYARCLRDLAAVNRLTLTHRPTIAWLNRQTRAWPPDQTISLLDVACGEGDLLRAIHRWAARRKIPVALAGIDLNPRSATVSAAAAHDLPITFVTGDVFAYAPDPKPDFIVTSQFTHHLSDPDLVAFLRWIEAYAAKGWFIADLHRHILPYYVFPLIARVAGWHRIVRTDGLISITRSFRRQDWVQALQQAGIAADIKWRLPFRYCVSRRK